MSGWHSLSGHLHYRTRGALSILKPKRRMWFMFEESQCKLMFYNSEADARRKPAIGQICIRGAAITLDLEQHNQFVIISDARDHVLTAENHESLMIWVIGLQAKRDACINRSVSPTGVRVSSLWSSESNIRKHKSCDWSANGDVRNNFSHHEPLKRSNTIGGPNNRQQFASGHRLVRQADSYNGIESCDKVSLHIMVNRSRSLPPLIEAACESKAFVTRPLSRSVTEEDLDSVRNEGEQLWSKGRVSSNESLDNHEDNDDVFGENYGTKNSEEKLRLTRHKQDEMSENSSKQNCDTINGYERTSSCSGLSSGSTDSAIDKGLADPHQELLGRMAELEQELITTKCELAKVLNQQTFFQEVLEKKDAIIEELDDTLDQLGVADFKRNLLYGGKFISKKKGKVLEERVRVLQNQNRFLNEEVKRLVKNRQSEQDRFRHQEERLQSYEAEIEGWKRNYVSIVQSCIHYPTGDAMDGADVTLYGEDTHKVTIKGLLAEARRTNPSLPTFERLASSPYHVDSYGFKHSHENTGLLLHYICQQLNLHYTMQLANYEQHQLRWKEYLCQHRDFTRSDKELKELCRGGIPHQYRKEVWRRLVYTQVQDLRKEKGCHFYRNLCNSLPDSQLAARYRKQISLDLMRTMPSNVKFSSVGSKGIHDLQDVLLAFCVHNPSVGYCQGLNFIVAMALLIMEPQDAFWTLIAVTEKYFSPNYFNHNLIGAQADQEVLREIILDKLPRLYQHLEDIDIEISTVTLNWFMAVFFDAVPFETLLRLWDCFLLEGPKVLFRFALAILKLHENDLLQKNDTISVMRHLKACAKLTYDADRLIKTAFEDLSPFPSRRDISVKQTCYLNVLKEKYKKREWHKRAYTEREQMLLEQKADSENSMLIECVACYDEGKLWLCHCANNVSNMCKVNCEENLMYTLNLQFQARILCMKALRQDIMLIGTVAWTLFAYDTRSREEKWQLQLHDAVMSLCVLKEGRHRRVFAGLADGTVAVIEHVRSTLPKTDVFYVPVGKSSVTSMTLVNDQLWCASGNMVYVLHARTLDAMDNFTVSANPYDQVLTLVAGEFGMWISLKGSSILELWDIKALSCKMLYDTRTCRYPNLRKEDDSYFNKARITSVLADNTCVMVGTGEGVMITFEVVERTPPKSSPEGSSCSDSRSSSPFWSTNQKHPNLAFDRNSQDKIKDYLKRLDEGQRWEENGEDWKNGEGKRFRDFDNISYPSSLACSEISNSVSNQDSSVQDKGVNPSENEQERVLRDGSDNESFLDVEVPSLSTPTADGKTLFASEQFSADVGDNCGVQSKAVHVTKEIDIALVNKTQDMNNGNYNENLMRNSNKVRSKNQDLESDLNNDEELSEKGFFVDEFVSDPDFANNNNNIPKISVIEDNRNSDRDDSENCLSVEQDITTSVGSSESFRSCEEKDDAIETTNEDKTLAEDQPQEPANTTDFFEDDVFYEAVSGTSFENKQTLKPGETVLESANKEIPSVSPSPEKEKSRSRMSRIKRRSKKLTSEVQYRLDFSDMKLSIDSNLSSSSFSERNSSLLSNFYPSDSSLDQLKSSLRVDNSLANSYSKSEDQIDMSTTRPVVVKSQRPSAGHLTSVSGFKRVSSLDAHIDSLGLSSLDDVSSHKESSETKDRLTVKTQISHNSSATSLCSLTEAQLYAYDLCLQSKVKIADKPVKCLLATSVKKEPVMISCAGCYGDDEAVLRWRKEPQEKMWTNEPIYEICEKTRETRLPSYMMHRRMSSVSSSHSAESQSSISSVVACGNT